MCSISFLVFTSIRKKQINKENLSKIYIRRQSVVQGVWTRWDEPFLNSISWVDLGSSQLWNILMIFSVKVFHERCEVKLTYYKSSSSWSQRANNRRRVRLYGGHGAEPNKETFRDQQEKIDTQKKP